MRLTHVLFVLVLGWNTVVGPLSAQTTGRSYLFAFGKARSVDPDGMRDLMETSIDDIARSYGSLRAPRFDVYADNLDDDDTFVVYMHTHGTERGLPVLRISFDDLRDALLAIPARNVVVFAMTCHSGALVASFNAARSTWNDRARQGRNLLVFSTVGTEELGSTSMHRECRNPFSYAVERAVKPRSNRRYPHRFDGADGYCPARAAWDGWQRYSGAVSMGELASYIPDITQWADDHRAYFAGTPRKHPTKTGSYQPSAVFVRPGHLRPAWHVLEHPFLQA